MPDTRQLPHLLKLLDDESETVQQAVTAALAAFGPSLERALARLPEPPDERQVQRIRVLLAVRQPDPPSPSDREEVPVATEPTFEPGQLVRHRRYGYRGVVVAVDLTCQADDEWYHSNRTQPDRGQPWYHVLVHDSTGCTYAAQTSLQEDDSEAQVSHPFISHFFSAFKDGQYTRNSRPWPGR